MSSTTDSTTNRPIATSCNICGKLFSWASSLALHMRIHTGEKPYKCDRCGKQFTQKVHLQRHHLVHQQTGTTEVQNSPIAPLLPQIDSVEPVRQYLLISTNQSNNFQSAKLLSQTVGNIRTVYPPVEQSASTKTLLNKPEMGQKIKPKTNLKNKVDCPECALSFDTKLRMMEHLYISHPTAELLANEQQKNQSIRSSFCQFCQKTFASSSSLGLHMRSHTGERPYQCKYCGKAFIQNIHLKAHLSKHTGVKPFSCRFCNKSFAISYSLKVHENIHIGRRIHTCKICRKSFFQQYQLIRHMTSHMRHRLVDKKRKKEPYLSQLVERCLASSRMALTSPKNPCEENEQPTSVEIKIEPIEEVKASTNQYGNASSCETDSNDEGLPAITVATERSLAEISNQSETSGDQHQQSHNCSKCAMMEGELQLLRTELHSVRQFLSHKLNLMDQRMDGMQKLVS